MRRIGYAGILGAFGLGILLAFGNSQTARADGFTQETTDTAPSYGIADVDTSLNVRSEPGMEGEIIGKMAPTAICEISSIQDGWAQIVSGEVEGYVSVSYLYTGEQAEAMVEEAGEENFPTAQSNQEELPAVVQGDVTGEQVVEYARNFLGNPYVWGGTSLTNGADCSGFTQSIYKSFGIQLPRTAAEQANVGTRVELDALQPGDLVFYSDGSSIYHVVIYAGNGQVVHASSSDTGIKESELYTDRAVWGVRLL